MSISKALPTTELSASIACVAGPYLSVVVLCYRSGRSMIPLIERLLCSFALQLHGELVLVGNYIEGSDDETPQVVRELAERWPNVSAVVRRKKE